MLLTFGRPHIHAGQHHVPLALLQVAAAQGEGNAVLD